MQKRLPVIVMACLLLMSVELSAKDKTLADTLWPPLQTGIVLIDFAPVYRAYSNFYSGGTGFTVEFGLNAGRLLGSKVIIAPYCGIEPSWGNRYASGFIDGLSANYVEIFDPMTSHNTMNDIDFWSLDRSYTLMDRMQKGETTGFNFTFRYGAAIQLPWRFIPSLRVFGLFSSMGVYETGTSADASGHAYGGGVYGPSLKGYGAEIDLWRGFKLMGDTIGSIWIGTVRLGVEFSNLSKARIWDEDEISGFRNVYLDEFVTPDFSTRYSKIMTVWIAVSFACR